MVNKGEAVEKIAELVRDKKIDGITELSDQSSREGMRVCIELRRDANANVILNQLYKHTQLQDTFRVIMLALVNNEPKVMKKISRYAELLCAASGRSGDKAHNAAQSAKTRPHS